MPAIDVPPPEGKHEDDGDDHDKWVCGDHGTKECFGAQLTGHEFGECGIQVTKHLNERDGQGKWVYRWV